MENYSLIYIQESYYLENLNVVLRNLENNNYKYISRKTLKSIPEKDQYVVKSTFDIIKALFSLRKINFEKFIACNVDDFYFHLIFRFASFNSFISYDEGQRSIILKDQYYFQKSFEKKGQKKLALMNRLFGFPKPFGEYYDYSDTHYTFYNFDLIEHNLRNHKNIIFLNKKSAAKSIDKVFVGQSSNWRYMTVEGAKNKTINLNSAEYLKKISAAAKVINRLNPDLYLMHPRENNDLIHLLNENINVVKNIGGRSHILINMLHKMNTRFLVYSDKSGVLFDISDEIEINFIDLFKRFETKSYKDFVTNFNKYRFGNNNNSPKAKILLTEDIK